jgi:activator of 2-hydroxyglutaryl-CoA dehydratase
MSEILSVNMIVPPRPNLIGGVGAAVMVSGMKELEEMR